MDTISTIRTAAAAVTGARHARTGRNGQDAAAAWARGRAGAIVVCDGCGAGASSEVGARLGAQLVIAALSRQLAEGTRAADLAMWSRMRTEITAQLGQLLDAMPGDRDAALGDHFLFTVVAAAWSDDEVAVWVVGDGAYALGDRVCTVGPFEDNQPPYLAYDLLGTPHEPHVETAGAGCGSVVVATDGLVDVGLASFVTPEALARFGRHPDALRRQLALHARTHERIDWADRRIDRRPAVLQDDGAIALLGWSS